MAGPFVFSARHTARQNSVNARSFCVTRVRAPASLCAECSPRILPQLLLWDSDLLALIKMRAYMSRHRPTPSTIALALTMVASFSLALPVGAKSWRTDPTYAAWKANSPAAVKNAEAVGFLLKRQERDCRNSIVCAFGDASDINCIVDRCSRRIRSNVDCLPQRPVSRHHCRAKAL